MHQNAILFQSKNVQNEAMTEYRARFDADVRFTNGGDLSVHGFLLDIDLDIDLDMDLDTDGTQIDASELGRRFVSSLGLLMAGEVSVSNVEIIEAPHKGSRGGPSHIRPGRGDQVTATTQQLVELSHVITAGLITYPGLPAPSITPFLTREQSRERYAPGTEFAMDCITLIGNTGTYLDSPYHRYEGGTDLADLPLSRMVDLPAVVVRVADSVTRGIDAAALAAIDPAAIAGAAVLLNTGGDARFGTPEYAIEAGFLTRDGAQWLVDQGVALVGIDSVNIDDVADTTRPAHSLLLEAGIPIVEHLTGLTQLPPSGSRFTAVPPRVAQFGTFPVRAFATVPSQPTVPAQTTEPEVAEQHV
jgi:arylformamidase